MNATPNIHSASIRDLGIRVEEAPEAPAPATEAPQTVTLEQIEAKIVREDYIQELNGGTLTICVLTLANGFDVVGTSGCADPARFDAELGRKYAREDAIKKIWPLEGYLLRERMWQAGEVEQTEARAADEGWGDPVTASAAVEPEAVADAAECATQGAAANVMDMGWLRQRAVELALSRLPQGWSIDGAIKDARVIEAYLSGDAAIQGFDIDGARATLMQAILKGTSEECDHAGNTIGYLTKWLYERSTDAPGAERQNELAQGIAHERKRTGAAA